MEFVILVVALLSFMMGFGIGLFTNIKVKSDLDNNNRSLY